MVKKRKNQFKYKKAKKRIKMTVDYKHPGKKQKGARIHPTTGKISC